MQNINTLYGQTARFDINRGMTEDEIRTAAPSVFATTAHESRSERFMPIPTIEVLRGLRKEGFEVVAARQAVTRVAGKADYTKHLLRLRRLGENKQYMVGDTVAEMVLKNANDGTSVYDLFAGLFRIRCLNSMVAHMGNIDTVKVRHTGKGIVGQVIEGTYSVIEKARVALVAPQEWAQIKLNEDERAGFAEAVHAYRFADTDGNVINAPVTPDKMLERRRREDEENNLWTDFNVAQENVMRGGLHGSTVDSNGKRRNVTTRTIKGIDQDVKLNRALWKLATKMATWKGWQEPEVEDEAA